jgi:signal transduction histidine kinase
MTGSTEKAKTEALQAIINYIRSDEIDVMDPYGDLLRVGDMAEKVLAASEETDLERLVDDLTEMEEVLEYGKMDYLLAGVPEDVADDRLRLVMIVLDEIKKHIADGFGVGEAEDADD